MDAQDIVLYNIDDIQRIFGLGRSRAYQLVNSDGFPVVRLNRKILVPKEKLSDWISKNCGKNYQY